MALAVNTIVEIKIGYTANDQQCFNVYHQGVYNGTGAGQDPAEWQETIKNKLFADSGTDGSVTKEMRDMMSDEVNMNLITVQIVYPVRYRLSQIVTTLPGLIAEPCNAQNVQATFTKLGDLGNRHNVGAWHQGGLPESSYVAGLLSAGASGALTNLANAFLAQQTYVVAGSSTTFGPVILNKTPIPDTDPVKYQISGRTGVSAVVPRDTIRVMRRRTLRVGI